MYQWGTQACGLAGRSAAQIVLTYYYPNVTVTDAPTPSAVPTASPSPIPSPTPRPTATATPRASATPTTAPTAAPTATPAPTRTPRPTATPTQLPTAVPTPQPTPSIPLATPPADQQLPGGGQSGISGQATPPPPPPDDPRPTVPRLQHRRHAAQPASPLDRSASRYSAWMLTVGYAGPAGFEHRLASMAAGGVVVDDSRLVALLPLWRAALANLEQALLRHLAAARIAGISAGMGSGGGIAGLP
jgi:hypothetical protein